MDLFRTSNESSLGLSQKSRGAKGILLPQLCNTVLSYKVCRSSLCPQPPQSALSQTPNTIQTRLPQHRPQCDSREAEQNTCPESLSWAIIGWPPMAGTGLSIHPSLKDKHSTRDRGHLPGFIPKAQKNPRWWKDDKCKCKCKVVSHSAEKQQHSCWNSLLYFHSIQWYSSWG